MERIVAFKIKETEAGNNVKKVLEQRLKISRNFLTMLKKWPEGILLNGEAVYVDKIVKYGDNLRVQLAAPEESSVGIIPRQGELNIIYEDEDLLIVNKAATVPVHPSKGHLEDSLANHLMYYYHSQKQNFVFRAVNRLDYGTSGLMAVAKNAYAHHMLSKQLQIGILKRKYLAVCCGEVKPPLGKISSPIRQVQGEATTRREIHVEGSTAITNYQVLSCNNDFSLVSLHLETGRTHQIRLHMSSIGFPLIGDFIYGKRDERIARRHGLHSSEISLYQPITHKFLSFTSALPDDLLAFCKTE
ncbi:MAG: RluA family pseudouridine synthase [Clostridia bacterium]